MDQDDVIAQLVAEADPDAPLRVFVLGQDAPAVDLAAREPDDDTDPRHGPPLLERWRKRR